ncbi:MAG: hypothetical protein ACYTEQ_02555 [Planctomycetota bacterium]|jgi:hypothetical protein
MVKWFSGRECWLVLVIVCVGGGCREQYKEEGAVPPHPLKDPNFAVSEPALGPLEASGGRQAWSRLEKLDFHGVVAFYQKDGSVYLTEQRHEINPSLNSIRISAKEPEGEFVWELSPDGFSMSEGAGRPSELLQRGVNRDFARAVLYITTSAARLSDESILLSKSSKLIRIGGLWYYPIEGSAAGMAPVGSSRPQTVFYQNAANSLVDMVSFGNSVQEVSTAVRGYDYREVEKGGVLVPTKIEIFAAGGGVLLKERLVRIDYHRMKSEE